MREVFITKYLQNGFVELIFNLPEEYNQKIALPFLLEMYEQLINISKNHEIKALILKSGKPGNFIRGWNCKDILAIRDKEQGFRLSMKSRECVRFLGQLPFPTICVIEGPCLGIGLELAMGCTYRIAVKGDNTFLGLPQVKWGVVPFSGASWMLPRLVGLDNALEMILSGSVVSAEEGYEHGLIDFLLSENEIEDTLKVLSSYRIVRKNHHLGDMVNVLGRKILFHLAKYGLIKQGALKNRSRLEALEIIRRSLFLSLEKAARLEAEIFSSLVVTREAKNQIHLYNGAERMKHELFNTPPLLAGEFRNYLLNRIFSPYIIEALRLVQEGFDFQEIDSVLVEFGMPLGPFSLMDHMGLKKVLEITGSRFSFLIMFYVEWDLEGEAGGKGFYIYKKGRKYANKKISAFFRREFNPKEGLKDINYESARDRCVLALVNEAAHCLDEKLVNDPVYVDVAVVQGMGFPAYRGGPIKYADQLSLPKVAEKLTLYSISYGERFAPSLVIKSKAQKKEPFYQDEYSI